MRYKTIEYTETDHIGIIDFKRNISDNDAIDLPYEISEACSAVVSKDDIYAVVLTGIGDNEPLNKLDPGMDIPDLEESGFVADLSVAGSIADIDKPVIAAVDGDAFDNALEIMLACDLRIASEKSRFGFCRIEHGQIPGNGGTQRLARLIGKARALEMILTGMVIDAGEAYRIGLVNKVISDKDTKQSVLEIAQGMCCKGPISLRYAKETINAGMDMTLEQGLRLEADLYMLLHTSQDRNEGISAFREKRKPLFHGK